MAGETLEARRINGGQAMGGTVTLENQRATTCQKSCRFYGIIIRMFYGDHRPPHFHAVYGSDEITVDILTGEIEGRFSRRALLLVLEWLDAHRNDLLENWNRLENDVALERIEPLPWGIQ